MPKDFDVIIIGSGLGGLTCGAFLARGGLKVCVLEQHTKIGGYAHSFSRNGYDFDIGIHSVPLSENGVIFSLLRMLGCDHKIETIQHPEMFRYVAPDDEFIMPSSCEDAIEHLKECFPGEYENIGNIYALAGELYRRYVDSIFDADKYQLLNKILAAKYRGITYKTFIERIIRNDHLKNIFYSQWPCVGISPEKASSSFSFMMFATHLFEGSHYCKNGFSSLAQALADAISASGGEVRISSKVISLKVDNKRVTHALLENGEDLDARVFVSNISPYDIYGSLFPQKARSSFYLKRLDKLRPSLSAIAIYLGIKSDTKHFMKGNLINWYSTVDHASILKRCETSAAWHPDHLMFLRKCVPECSDTVTILYLVNGAFSSSMRDFKDVIAEQIIRQVEKICPGLAKCIDICATASPTTFERYTSNTLGALFGFENVADSYREAKMPQKYHLHNLYNTGHWGLSGGGVWNVMVNGYRVSQTVLKGNPL